MIDHMALHSKKGNARRALIVSDSWNEMRARLLREGELLTSCGIEVTVAGASRSAPLPHSWSCIDNLGGTLSGVSSLRTLRMFLNGAACIWGDLAGVSYWRANCVRQMKALFELMPPQDIIIAHNWPALPLCVWLKKRWDVPLVADFHEYALGENMEQRRWVHFVKPMIKNCLDRNLRHCDEITVVSEGIGKAMVRDHGLHKDPVVIRSTPFAENVRYREPDANQITVLYHGNLVPHRGLEETITSVRLWLPHFKLILRGNGRPSYVKSLRDLAKQCDVANRIAFESAVPREVLISRANEADIGLFVIAGESPQRKFVLPNKFFEYVQSGLALCVSDLPEMRGIVNRYDLGLLVGCLTASEIAQQINALDVPAIRRFKRNSLLAAKELNWTHEREKLREVYRSVGLNL